MKIYLFFIIVIFCLSHVQLDADEYMTDYFQEDSGAAGMFICLYLGKEFSYADDAEELFNKFARHISLNAEVKSNILKDAKKRWENNRLNFEKPEDEIQDIYWEINCEEPTQKMREFFTDKTTALR